MSDKLFENYDCLYTTLYSATMLTNNCASADAVHDVREVVGFVASAYGVDDDVAAELVDATLQQTASMSLMSEFGALCNRNKSANQTETDMILFAKGEVLASLDGLCRNNSSKLNPDWFNYTYRRAYQAEMRFHAILETANFGIVTAVREAGIMRALGIGCEKSLGAAILRFRQCALWGDIPSMRFLAYAHKLNNDEKNAAVCADIVRLAEKYLLAGLTVIPKDEKSNYNATAAEWFAVISSVKQDVINAKGKTALDFSFAEAILTPELDFASRMRYVDEYDQMKWRTLTNSPYVRARVGFYD